MWRDRLRSTALTAVNTPFSATGRAPWWRASPSGHYPPLAFSWTNPTAVDASVVATTERLSERQLLTLDRRHFTIVRPRHTDAFELLP